MASSLASSQVAAFGSNLNFLDGLAAQLREHEDVRLRVKGESSATSTAGESIARKRAVACVHELHQRGIQLSRMEMEAIAPSPIPPPGSGPARAPMPRVVFEAVAGRLRHSDVSLEMGRVLAAREVRDVLVAKVRRCQRLKVSPSSIIIVLLIASDCF